MGCRELCGGVHTNTDTYTDAIGFQTHCVSVGASVGKDKSCVGVGQCEHTINHALVTKANNIHESKSKYSLTFHLSLQGSSTILDLGATSTVVISVSMLIRILHIMRSIIQRILIRIKCTLKPKLELVPEEVRVNLNHGLCFIRHFDEAKKSCGQLNMDTFQNCHSCIS